MFQILASKPRTRRVAQMLLVAVAALLVAEAAFSQATSNPSKILEQYRSERIQWTTNIWPYANTLFGILATIEFAWSAAVMMLEKTDLQSWVSALIRKVMWIGAFYALLLNGHIWIPAIIDSFEQIGSTSSGVAALSPSSIFSQGLNIAGSLMDSASTSAFFVKPGSSLALVFAAIIIVLSYVIITLQFIVAMVESYIVVAAGFVFVGFGGSRWTVPYTERYIGLAVSTGIKIMLLYLLIGAGFNFAIDWQTEATTIATSPKPMMTAFDIMGAAVIFMMLCLQIPKLFSAVLGGAPALTGGDLISTGTGLVAGAATAASLGAGTVAVAARGASTIASVSAAANAGAGSGAGAGSASVAGGGLGPSSAGPSSGSVPPPSSAGPSTNGSGPKQPDPPTRGSGSGGASADLASVGSNGSNGTSGARNGSTGGSGSNGNGATRNTTINGVEDPRASQSSFDSNAVSGRKANQSRNGSTGPSDSNGNGSGGNTTTNSVEDPRASQNSSGATGASAGRTADQVLSDAARRLKQLGSRVQTLSPSDSAPHSTPPRMPIDHQD